MDGPEPQTWFNTATVVISALVGIVWRMITKRVESIDETQRLLEARISIFVTRDEMQSYFNQMRGDRIQQHVENLGRLDRLADEMTNINKRIDGVIVGTK
jgi:hypothetical protein